MSKRVFIGMVGVGFTAGLLAGCGDPTPTVLGGIPAVAYIQRDVGITGNIFDYTGGKNGNIFTLTPPTASGVKKNLTNWEDGDVSAMDISFDAREIAFSGRAPGENNYHLYRINVDGSNPCDAAQGKQTVGPCQITDGPHNDAYPTYLPGGRIFFVTSESVEVGQPQFRDEYERATTAQAASIPVEGGEPDLGPRNVSHRVAPSMMRDGRIILTEWRHLGDVNDGDLTTLNQDLTGSREAFGREGTGVTNSYLRAREIEPGKIVAIGTSRDRTFQSGKILVINLGGTEISSQSEARAKAEDLTPDVPGGREPSFAGVGRYYDAFPVGDSANKQFLVSWADGPVETDVLGLAKLNPDFGIYLFDGIEKTRFPIANELNKWETSPMPIVARDEPKSLKGAFAAEGTQSTLFGAINVYDSTIFKNLPAGAVKKVRLSEGFSGEEGVPNMFGLTEFDGMSRLGEADVSPSGAFKALVPPNIPIRMQLLDEFGMNMGSEPLWVQGRPGEARVCGGCHEDRTSTPQIAPGSSVLQAVGAAAFDLPRAQRTSMNFAPESVRGVPWDKAIQPILTERCADCHDGTPGAANPTYMVTDMMTMTTTTHTFDLTAKLVTTMFMEEMYNFPASYVTLIGPSDMMREQEVMVTGEFTKYVELGQSRADLKGKGLYEMLNPPRRYPTVDENVRAYPGKPVHPQGVSYNGFNGSDAKYKLTPDEYYLLLLMGDNGGQFYSRENAEVRY